METRYDNSQLKEKYGVAKDSECNTEKISVGMRLI